MQSVKTSAILRKVGQKILACKILLYILFPSFSFSRKWDWEKIGINSSGSDFRKVHTPKTVETDYVIGTFNSQHKGIQIVVMQLKSFPSSVVTQVWLYRLKGNVKRNGPKSLIISVTKICAALLTLPPTDRHQLQVSQVI